MTGYTPGPWELMRGGALWGGMDLKMVEYQDEDGEWCTLTRLECDLPDARLIAAAPELMDALEAMHACHRAFSDNENWTALDDEARALAEAAIAKAKGEA